MGPDRFSIVLSGSKEVPTSSRGFPEGFDSSKWFQRGSNKFQRGSKEFQKGFRMFQMGVCAFRSRASQVRKLKTGGLTRLVA